jgi:hypothetical protein
LRHKNPTGDRKHFCFSGKRQESIGYLMFALWL